MISLENYLIKSKGVKIHTTVVQVKWKVFEYNSDDFEITKIHNIAQGPNVSIIYIIFRIVLLERKE